MRQGCQQRLPPGTLAVCLIYLPSYQSSGTEQTKTLLGCFLIRQPRLLHFQESFFSVRLQFADNLPLGSRVQPQIMPDIFEIRVQLTGHFDTCTSGFLGRKIRFMAAKKYATALSAQP